MKRYYNVPIARLTTFQTAGSVPEVVVLETVSEVREFVSECSKFAILGKGSNALIDPAITFPIVQISPAIVETEVNGSELTVSASTTINQLLKLLIEHELTGLEFMAGVPASVGGMVAMNFGCWGKEISDFLSTITVVTREGEVRELNPKDLNFGYRSSACLSAGYIVLSVTFSLGRGEREQIKKQIDGLIQQRLEKQPLRSKTFGSIFKNLPNEMIGKILDDLGLKGRSNDQAAISTQHANFMTNLGDATFDQAYGLIEEIKEIVLAKKNLSIECEVQIIR